MSIEELTDQNFDEELAGSDIPMVVDFWAPWCGPCRAVSPIIEQLSEENQGRVRVVKLNTDENPGTATRYGISSIPAILFFKGGEVVHQLVGLRSKPDFQKVIDEVVGPSPA